MEKSIFIYSILLAYDFFFSLWVPIYQTIPLHCRGERLVALPYKWLSAGQERLAVSQLRNVYAPPPPQLMTSCRSLYFLHLKTFWGIQWKKKKKFPTIHFTGKFTFNFLHNLSKTISFEDQWKILWLGEMWKKRLYILFK